MNIKTPKNYTELHHATVDVLHALGYPVARKKRIDPFRIWVKVERNEKLIGNLLVPTLRSLLSAVIEMRKAGFEPDHKGGHYL